MKKSEKGKKKPSENNNRKKTTTWVCAIFFVSAWMFALGVFVGRGTAPVKFDIEKLQKELSSLKYAVVKDREGRGKLGRGSATPKMELGFYETLREKKPKERHKVKQPVKKKTLASQKKVKPGPPQKIEKTISRAKKAKASAGTVFTIQVSSLKDGKVAVEMAEMLKRKGYQAYTVSAKIPDMGSWHRIRIGHFKNRSDAADILNRLKKEKYMPIIVQE